MATPSSQQVLEALGRIKDPDLGRDVVSLGMIKELEVSPEGKVSFTFELTTPACPVRDRFKSQAEDAVRGIAGVTGVEVRMTANVRPAFMRPSLPRSFPESSRRSRWRRARAGSASRRSPLTSRPR